MINYKVGHALLRQWYALTLDVCHLETVIRTHLQVECLDIWDLILKLMSGPVPGPIGRARVYFFWNPHRKFGALKAWGRFAAFKPNIMSTVGCLNNYQRKFDNITCLQLIARNLRIRKCYHDNAAKHTIWPQILNSQFKMQGAYDKSQ